MAGKQRYISIHVPLAGHDVCDSPVMLRIARFQSTCPLRGTTKGAVDLLGSLGISIHVPLAGHDHADAEPGMLLRISIHVPLAGHDQRAVPACGARGFISIHVPLAGHDYTARMS